MRLADFAESSITVIVALILLIAIALVVFGLARAVHDRLRPQLVITDLTAVDDFPAAATAGLSAQLRHRVRREMYGRDAPNASSLVATVGGDIDSTLVELVGVQRDDLQRLQDAMLAEPVRRLLRSSPDDLAPVAGGLRAIAPDRADGLLGALAAALPRQRGTLVQVTPSARIDGDMYQVGLTLDVGPIAGPPDSSATIWHDLGTAVDECELSARQRGALYELLPWASRWIALRLVATTPPPRGARRLTAEQRRVRSREWTALSRILTGQLALYEMKGARIRPAVALGFVDQALEDCDVAGRLMRAQRYFRPVRLEAYLEEARAYLRLDLADAAPAGTTARGDYERLATDAFRRAADRFVEVRELLSGRIEPFTERHRALALRLVKARLLAGDGLAVLDDVPDPVNADARHAAAYDDLYNEACLWSVIVRVARPLDPELSRRARQECGLLLDLASTAFGAGRDRLIAHAKRDPDFTRTFTAPELDELVRESVR